MKQLLMALGLLSCCFFAGAQEMQPKMTSLFNGKNLEGWYSFLGKTGKNNDPEKVFTIENGLLHITGKDFGYLCTNKSFRNFHLVAEFKWGTKKYPPRDADTTRRDNGILYYFAADATDKVWPKSVEFQIQEGDVGDIWLIDSATVVVDGKRSTPKDFTRVRKKLDGEHPTGEWNRVELIARDGKITYIVNGITVNTGEDLSLREGKITVQSEGAEIYYRKIEIAEL
jgi:hypothetical protein